jgi:hypothetical protein
MSSHRYRSSALVTLVAALGLLCCGSSWAFPPYRSTDAETAEPFVLEARLGLLRLRRTQSSNSYSVPLLRLNYGLPRNWEIVTEGEFDASEGKVADAAAGLKWVPWAGTVSFGIEALVLLPVSSEGGAGTETQALMTARILGALLHLNAGGIYDARPAETEKGWRASVLGEAPLGRWRPGLELFNRQFQGGDLEALAGAGMIVGFGPMDLRLGAHVGLTDQAPDLVLNLWVASKLRTAREDPP